VAEDNALNQKLITTILSKRGHQIKTVCNGKEAVEAFDITPYDVVLLDHEMPVMNGLEASSVIRLKDPSVPIISMSGYISTEIDDLRRKSGVNRIITKPFTVKTLLTVVESAYADRQSERNVVDRMMT